MVPRKKSAGRPKKKVTTGSKAAAKTSKKEGSGFEDRIANIETILTSMFEMILEIQKNVGVVSTISLKQLLQQLIHKGDSMTIDELEASFPGDYDWGLIEQALIHLIEDEVFKPSKGQSKRKVGKNFGVVTHI